MKDWKMALIAPENSIFKAMQIIDTSSMQIALVIDEHGRLLGTVTDGDIRRAILKGIQIDEAASKIMNAHPVSVPVNESRENILAIMKKRGIHQIPMVDDHGRVVGIETINDLLQFDYQENWAVLMAGGLGTRLSPLTDDCPKPLLNVGGKPLLETILQNFIEFGFRKFYISVNYKADMIENYFGDGSKWGVCIRYIREDKRLGTAGALGLLPEKPEQPFFVMNGDLLTKVNFQQLLRFHNDSKSKATMCVREYNVQIPYGVVKIDRDKLIGIDEKPLQRFFISAGIYVLEPEVLNTIKKDQYLDMPDLFKELISAKAKTAVFPIREYWLDIGRTGDFEQANGEFKEVFG